jgi:ankyrin repeat protein
MPNYYPNKRFEKLLKSGSAGEMKRFLASTPNPKILLTTHVSTDLDNWSIPTPLTYVICHGGDTKLIEVLLQAGADPNQPEQTGWERHVENDGGIHGQTPLMYAASRYDRDLVQLLLRYGADPQKVDKRGRSARNYATEGDIIDLLNEASLQAEAKQSEPLSHIKSFDDASLKRDIIRERQRQLREKAKKFKPKL